MSGEPTFETKLYRISFILWTVAIGLIVSAVVARPKKKELNDKS